MFNHKLGGSEFDSAIISSLAVIGLDLENQGWIPAENYTPKLSAMVTVTRALVVYIAYGHR